MHSISGVRSVLITLAIALTTVSVALVADPALAAPAPSVGECYALTLDQAGAKANPEPAVDCNDPHTLRTIAVGKLPKNLDWSSSAAAIGRAVDAVCVPARDEALGRSESTRLMSAYSTFWFEPTSGQRDRGARWFTCELGLRGGTKLLDLPTDATPALPKAPLPDSVARCLQGNTWLATTCDRRHAYRAAGTFVMRHDGFPSDRVQGRIVSKRCSEIATPNFVAWFITRSAWKAGHRTVVCYTKTRA